MNKKGWITGSGREIIFKDILIEIERYVADGGKIFIGSDSQLCNNTCIFATAICLHGAKGSKGGKYFFKRFKDKGPQYSNLKLRIMSEVTHTLDVAMDLMGMFPDSDIEVHVDIGRGPRSKTSGYIDHIQGWAQSTGLICKVKPNAWASASVADKHTK